MTAGSGDSATDPARAANVDDRLAWAQDTALVLGRLPRAEARVVHLRYVQRLPERDVAARLGLTAAEVRAALAAGLRRLGRLLQQGGTHGTAFTPRR